VAATCRELRQRNGCKVVSRRIPGGQGNNALVPLAGGVVTPGATAVGDGGVSVGLVGALGDTGLARVPGVLLPATVCPVRLPGCPVVLPGIEDVDPGDVVDGGGPSNVPDNGPGVVIDGTPGVVVDGGVGDAVVGGSDGVVNGVVADGGAVGLSGVVCGIGTQGANGCCEADDCEATKVSAPPERMRAMMVLNMIVPPDEIGDP